MPPRRVELTIEELVVEGVDVGDRGRFVAALERELARLVTERPPGGGHAPDPPEVSPIRAATPEAWGRAVAARVHASLPPPEPSARGST